MANVPAKLSSIFQNNQNNCSGFLRAVDDWLKVGVPALNADGIITAIVGSKEWVKIGSGPEAGKQAADFAGKGYVVLAMLKSSEHYPFKWDEKTGEYDIPHPYSSGHVAVVLDDATPEGYPYIICGSDDSSGYGRSAGDKAVKSVPPGIKGVWRSIDAPKVYYYRTKDPAPQLQPAAAGE